MVRCLVLPDVGICLYVPVDALIYKGHRLIEDLTIDLCSRDGEVDDGDF